MPWRLSRWTSAQSCTPNTFSSSGRQIDPSIGRNLGFAPEDRPGCNRREVSSFQPGVDTGMSRAETHRPQGLSPWIQMLLRFE
jgi:hypothetical protein